jgi:hypothetical protein
LERKVVGVITKTKIKGETPCLFKSTKILQQGRPLVRSAASMTVLMQTVPDKALVVGPVQSD